MFRQLASFRSGLGGASNPPTRTAMINWTISFFLLAFVSLFFSTLGTDAPFASLVGRILAASFLILAVAMFGMYLKHRHRHPGSN